MSRVALVVLALASSCASSQVRFTMADRAPPVEPRPAGCHVDVFEDGQQVTRPHRDLGRLVLEVSGQELAQQGPAGAMRALQDAACERGAFLVKDLRALPTAGASPGVVYEGTLATLLGDDGKPVNAIAAPPVAEESPPASGW